MRSELFLVFALLSTSIVSASKRAAGTSRSVEQRDKGAALNHLNSQMQNLLELLRQCEGSLRQVQIGPKEEEITEIKAALERQSEQLERKNKELANFIGRDSAKLEADVADAADKFVPTGEEDYSENEDSDFEDEVGIPAVDSVERPSKRVIRHGEVERFESGLPQAVEATIDAFPPVPASVAAAADSASKSFQLGQEKVRDSSQTKRKLGDDSNEKSGPSPQFPMAFMGGKSVMDEDSTLRSSSSVFLPATLSPSVTCMEVSAPMSSSSAPADDSQYARIVDIFGSDVAELSKFLLKFIQSGRCTAPVAKGLTLFEIAIIQKAPVSFVFMMLGSTCFVPGSALAALVQHGSFELFLKCIENPILARELKINGNIALLTGSAMLNPDLRIFQHLSELLSLFNA